MEISKSILGLTKSNNGFFKSEKQAQFLISQMESLDGCIGHADSGYNSCPIFASWDGEGITKLVKSTKNGDVLMFERKTEGVLTALELKQIKSHERKIKALEKEINERQKSFDDGRYNGTLDTSTYSNDMIQRFEFFQNQKKEQVKRIKEITCRLKK